MKRKLLVILLCVAAFGLFGMGGKAEEPAKAPVIGIVNTAQLYEKSDGAKKGMERLEKVQADAIARLETMQAELAAAQEAKDEAKVKELEASLQENLYKMQAVLTAEQEKVVGVLQKVMDEVMQAYRQEKGLTAILAHETVLTFDSAADVTEDIIKALNAKTIDFGAVPTFDAAPAAAAPGAPSAAPAEAATPATPAAPSTDKPAAPAAEAPAPAAPAEKPAQ